MDFIPVTSVRCTSTVVRTALALALVLAAACSKPAEPLKIVAVDLGSRINEDSTVPAATETFTSANTVYVSVSVEGTGPGTLAARWTSAGGEVLAEQTLPIAPTASEHFAFQFAPPNGWPIGRHKVVVTLNGGGSRAREFSVR
jgi:hypothetical protein